MNLFKGVFFFQVLVASSGLPELLKTAHYLEIQSLGRYRTRLGQKHVEIVRKSFIFYSGKPDFLLARPLRGGALKNSQKNVATKLEGGGGL